MNETKPSPGSLPRPTPAPAATPISFEPSDDSPDLLAQIEQWQTANAELAAANESLLAQLAQLADPLLNFGSDVQEITVNARSIGSVSLTEQQETDGLGATRSLGVYAVMVDQCRVTDYLPRAQALAARKQTEDRWRAALQPPARS